MAADDVRTVSLTREARDQLEVMAGELRLESRKVFASRLYAIVAAWDAVEGGAPAAPSDLVAHTGGTATLPPLPPPGRVEFEMTEEQCERILDASKPVPYMIMGGVPPRSPAQYANEAWRALGKEMGFDWETVKPVPDKGHHFFTAVPLEAE